MATFKDLIWNFFPPWFSSRDSYKDSNNQGLLERYVKSLGSELDEEVIGFINNLLNILQPSICPEALLVNLSSNLGYIPSFDQNIETYRRIIANAVPIYKLKGSILGYELLFAILGYSIELVEEVPLKPVIYDGGFEYDDEANFYDLDCQWCSGYYLKIYPLSLEPNFVISAELRAIILKICNFLQPINATYRGVQSSEAKTAKYGWVEEISSVLNYEGIQDLQFEINILDPDQDLECNFTSNTNYKYLVLAEPDDSTTEKTNWFGTDLNKGEIGTNIYNAGSGTTSPVHAFVQNTRLLTVPGWRLYYSAYKTKQTQTTIKFRV